MTMVTFQQFLADEAKRTEYDFSSTQIDLSDDLARRIVSWGRRNVPQRDIFTSETDSTFGREQHPHITLLYGIHTDKAGRIRRALDGERPFTVTLGKLSLFTTNDKFDVLKIEVKGSDLPRLNKTLSDSLYTTQTHLEYQPHITIAYLKKEKGDRWKGEKVFDGEEFEVSAVVFSSWKGTKTTIKLKSDPT